MCASASEVYGVVGKRKKYDLAAQPRKTLKQIHYRAESEETTTTKNAELYNHKVGNFLK